MALARAASRSLLGIVVDRLGVPWMINGSEVKT